MTHAPPPSGPTEPASTADAAQRLLKTMTAPRLLMLFGILLTVPMAGVIGRYLVQLQGVTTPDGEVATGDFVVFYMGGRVILDGHGSDLYDREVQHSTLKTVTGPQYRYRHWFVNPPLFAIALAPLTALPFVSAFYAYDAVMIACMILGLWLLKPHLAALNRSPVHWWTAVLLVVTFHPIARTMFGGQNTPLTFMLLAATYAFLRGGRPWCAGLMLGLLTYKPQYVLLIGVGLLLRRDWRCLAGAAVVGLGHYALGAAFCGIDWPLNMLQFLSTYRVSETATNFHLHIALLPALTHALPPTLAKGLAGVAIAGLLWMALAPARGPEVRSPQFGLLWALWITGSMLVSPHTQYYDVGLVALAVLLCIEFMLSQERVLSPRLRILLIAGFLGYPTYAMVNFVGFQPLVLWPLLTFGWTMALLRPAQHDDQPAHQTGVHGHVVNV